jgi:hypothetical protein
MQDTGPNGMKDLYRRWLQAVWGAGKLELSHELIAEDIVDHNPYTGRRAALAREVARAGSTIVG